MKTLKPLEMPGKTFLERYISLLLSFRVDLVEKPHMYFHTQRLIEK